MQHRIIPLGIYDIVSGEALITVCLIGIIVTILSNYPFKKATWSLKDIAFIGVGLYAGSQTFADLYTNYGWSWIARGSYAGILFGVLFLIIGFVFSYWWLYKKI